MARKTVSMLRDPDAALAYLMSRTRADDNGCLIWQGARSYGDYGTVSIERLAFLVHRLMYELHNGPIPDRESPGLRGFMVLHHCDNPPCCNPAHLYMGTAADNAQDAAMRCRITYGFRRRYSSADDRSLKYGTVFWEFCGEIKTLREWADQFGIHEATLDRRFLCGWPERSIPLPTRTGYRHSNLPAQGYRRFSGEREVAEYLEQKERPTG